MKTTWNELDPYSQPKPFVSVRLSLLGGQFIADYLALLDTGSRWSFIPGVVLSQDTTKEAMDVDLQLPFGMRKRMTLTPCTTEESAIWLSGPQKRPGFDFRLELGGHRLGPVTFFLAPVPRGMKPHLILGCDILFADGGLCIDALRHRFRLSICPSEAVKP